MGHVIYLPLRRSEAFAQLFKSWPPEAVSPYAHPAPQAHVHQHEGDQEAEAGGQVAGGVQGVPEEIERAEDAAGEEEDEKAGDGVFFAFGDGWGRPVQARADDAEHACEYVGQAIQQGGGCEEGEIAEHGQRVLQKERGCALRKEAATSRKGKYGRDEQHSRHARTHEGAGEELAEPAQPEAGRGAIRDANGDV